MPTAISEFTGEPVDTWSEAWRHECECRHVLDKIPTREQRNAFLEKVAKARGEQAAARLKADALRLHQLRQERNKPAA